MSKIMLKEIFKDFDVVVDSTFRGRYKRKFKIEPLKKRKHVSLDDLYKYVDYLRKCNGKKYPGHKWKVIRVRIQDGVLETTDYTALKEGLESLRRRIFPSAIDMATRARYRKELEEMRKKDLYVLETNMPIFFDLEEQRFYVADIFLKKVPKLVNYIIMRTLGKLGISQSKYIRPTK